MDDARRVAGPAFGKARPQPVQGGLVDPAVREIEGVKAQPAVFPPPGGPVCADRQGAGKDVSSVVICMLADQVDPAGGKKDPGPFARAEFPGKCFKQNVCPFIFRLDVSSEEEFSSSIK